MDVEHKLNLCLSVAEECIQVDELKKLFENKEHPICYDGFEPSGRMHIAQGIMKTLNVNKMTRAGCKCIFWVADWFALLNNKMGGDIEKIKNVGKYMIEIWKATGMDLENVTFLWSSDEINKHASEYWPLVMDIACKNKLPRILRCVTIMGRSETDELTASQIMYPCMQCADIFMLKADICQLGMDQRKINMLAREYCDATQRPTKPVILSHHMLSGLKKGQEKMSKSDPSSAIFMEDSEEDVYKKIRKAFCPLGEVNANPCMDYMKHIVFLANNTFQVERSPENGGNVMYHGYEQFASDYMDGKLHPADVKDNLARAINILIEPVRKHFKENDEARHLLELVQSYQ